MRALGGLMKHVRLVTRMARTTGADLTGAADAGDLSQDDWARMVMTCRRCGWTGHCDDWLNQHDRAGCAPQDCPNRARFESLKARARARKGP